MKTPSPSARTYRRLGYLALAHAVALYALAQFSLGRGTDEPGYWLYPLWIGLVTLWFLWPVVLALHHGRSARRFAVFISIAVVLMLPILLFYNMVAPSAFGWPDGVSLNPLGNWQYFSAYRAGRAEAKKDLAAGILALEEYGFGAAYGSLILRNRYQIEVRAIAGCGVDNQILGHAAGYNSVSEPEIDGRVGRDQVAAAREEGVRLANEELARQRQSSEDLARRLSRLPPDARLKIESIWPSLDEQPLNDPEAEEELGQLVRVVERYLLEHVPRDAPSCKFCVVAKATPTSSLNFEISCHTGPLPVPEPEWDSIENNLQTIAAPRWRRGSLAVTLYFVVQ